MPFLKCCCEFTAVTGSSTLRWTSAHSCAGHTLNAQALLTIGLQPRSATTQHASSNPRQQVSRPGRIKITTPASQCTQPQTTSTYEHHFCTRHTLVLTTCHQCCLLSMMWFLRRKLWCCARRADGASPTSSKCEPGAPQPPTATMNIGASLATGSEALTLERITAVLRVAPHRCCQALSIELRPWLASRHTLRRIRS